MGNEKWTLTRQNMNTVAIRRGSAGNVPIFSWDFVGKCKREECGIFERCNYAGGMNINTSEYNKLGDICWTQKRYVDHVFNTLIFENKDRMTPEQSVHLGLFIMPLFGHLIRFKIAEAGNDDTMVTTYKGARVVNPIYKEIRETVKVLTFAMVKLGLDGTGLEEDTEDFVNGDPSYYERMYGNEGGQESGNGEEGEQVGSTVHTRKLHR
jgi:hypothetical protein